MAPPDPTGLRLRQDLRRLHRALGTATVLRRAIDRLGLAAPPRRLLDLGGGDGTLLLRLARGSPPAWRGIEVTMLDPERLVSASTRAAFASVGWSLRTEPIELLDWAWEDRAGVFDLGLATLRLHRLDPDTRARLLPVLARRTMAFVACEPRRGVLTRLGGQLLPRLLGSGPVLREHALRGASSGLAGRELAADWPPAPGAWAVDEFPAGLFLHCFSAVRVAARARERRLPA